MSPVAGEAASKYLVLSDEALFAQCAFDRFRSHGPGGQKRNKTDSAVRLRHSPTGVVAIAVESRSQHENRARAIQRLRLELALQLRTEVDLDVYVPGPVVSSCFVEKSPLNQSRKQALDRSLQDEDGGELDPDENDGSSKPRHALRLTQRDLRKPQVYAELLDVLSAAHGQVSVAAERLGISTGNLVRVLREDTKVWGEVGRIRQSFGLAMLK